ncbi:hypothetical protein Bbelb_209070 [Branchiostoma belcheri]|nr:hypothetical protein Bbelb_209070 [Branchiostoma belcheri]
MEEDTDGSPDEDGMGHVLSLGSTSRDLQTAYLVISLVLSVGCGLLLIFLVWKKEYLQKPSHYLRCNLAVDDIVFTGCLIPVRIYALFRQDASGGQTWCSAEALVAPACTVSMYGTYLMMAVDLYYFVCHPLHYHDNVTTKRVVLGILAFRVLSLFGGLAPVAFGGLPKYNCVEARRQQERDENRDLWVFQTKAFKVMVPHIAVLTVSTTTVGFRVAMGRAVITEEHMSLRSLMIAERVAILLYLTVSSVANPVIYSFRLPEFRRACRELCGLPTNANPPPPPAPTRRHRQDDTEMATFTGPRRRGAPASELAPAQVSSEGLIMQFTAEDMPSDQAEKQTTQADTTPDQRHTTSGRPIRLTVRAEVHAEPRPRPGQKDATVNLPGQVHTDAEEEDVPTITLAPDTDEPTAGHARDRPPSRPRLAWEEDAGQYKKGDP